MKPADHPRRDLDATREAQLASTRRRPVSPQQQRLWFIDQLDPGSPAYNLAAAYRLYGRLDREALQHAVTSLVERHEAIRTRIETESGAPVQVIDAPQPVPIRLEDLRGPSPGGRERELEQCLRAEISRPFQLDRDLMLRARLICLDEEEHVLVLTMHHIASDAWSMSILCRELATLYAAAASGTSADLPLLRTTYADFAAWQRDRLGGEGYERDLAYWKEQLAGLRPLDILPDRPPSSATSNDGAQHYFTLSRDLTGKLQALSRAERVTLFMTLLAGFKVLLMRYTGQEDVAVGIPTAGRTRRELEALIGFFVDTLVLRTDLTGEPSFREILARVRQTALQAFSRLEAPFEDIVAAINPDRSFGDNPLFQVLFNFQNAWDQVLELQGLRSEEIELEYETSKFHLMVTCSEQDGELKAKVTYRTALFDRETVERLAEHYRMLLEAAVADPDACVLTLPFLPEKDRRRILFEWNATEKAHPLDRPAHELFEEQASRTPDAVAVTDETRSFTYADLDRRANRIAHYLMEFGVGPEHKVGVCLHRSAEIAPALLAIMKAGGAFVPLDPSYPPKRLSFILSEAGASLLVTDSSLADLIPDFTGRVVCLDAERDRISQHAGEAPVRRAGPGNLAYVMFTSGSTGRPKGVQIEHRSLTNYLCDVRDRFGYGPDTVLLSVISFSFDPFLHDLFGPLISGGRVAIIPWESTLDGGRIGAALARFGATGMNATPTTWRMLLASGWTAPRAFDVISRGEVLSQGLAVALSIKGGRVWNLYGPTETTLIASATRLREGERVTVGRPISNARIYILDRRLQPVPIGVRGTIHIGGEGLSRGYLNQPELTRDRFVPDPFNGAGGARMYDTGDLGRFLPDGRIVYDGRADAQVKIRGHRIELAEIESVLVEHPQVRAAVVVALGQGTERHLIAWLILSDGLDVPVAELRSHLRQHLPEPMIPSRFLRIYAFPLTSNGKVDRVALSGMAVADEGTTAVDNRPASPVERALASIWSEVLRLEDVSVDADFFDVGGHSLMAALIISRVNAELGVDLPLRSVFDAPTIASMAEIIETLLPQEDGGVDIDGQTA